MFSLVRLAEAFATLTYDSPTVTFTTASALVSKVTYPPVLTPDALAEPAETVPPDQVPNPVGVRSNRIAK